MRPGGGRAFLAATRPSLRRPEARGDRDQTYGRRRALLRDRIH